MKTRTTIHMVGGERVRCDWPLSQVLPYLRDEVARTGVLNIPIIKDHGEVRDALIPFASVVWFESHDAPVKREPPRVRDMQRAFG